MQWELSIQELFRLDAPLGLSSTFIGDPMGTGFTTDVEFLDITPELWTDYQRATEDVAQYVARSPERLAAIMPPEPDIAGREASATCFAPAVVAELALCCGGAGRCVPGFMLPDAILDDVSPCEGGGYCTPAGIIDALRRDGSYTTTPCDSIGANPGVCASTCLPEVALYASFLPSEGCGQGSLCAPCIDPVSGTDSGACLGELTCPDGLRSSAEVDAIRDEFLEHFGKRIFRRPLETDELERYQALFDAGLELLQSEDPVVAGVEITLRAMLLSPHFLFRVEASDTMEPDGTIRLSGWEIATRLSYTLWNTTPNDMLLEAAESGELDTRAGVLDWATVMLEDSRVRSMVVDFHRQLMRTDSYDDIQKQPGMFPDFLDTTGQHMLTESELFVEDVVFGANEGGFIELLTSTDTFVNRELAVLYGLDADLFGEEFERVTLDSTQRSGLLTRLGFLADRASLTQPDPIHRGVLVAQRVICAELPPPPANVVSLPAGGGATNRQRVENHTGEGTCGQGCHSTMINPAGYPFEHYDAIGRYREEDNGYPVNAADIYTLDGTVVAYADALEFSDVLAASQQVHACYAKHWLEYLYGREYTDADTALIDGVAEATLAGNLSILETIAALLASEAFLSRSTEEQEAEL